MAIRATTASLAKLLASPSKAPDLADGLDETSPHETSNLYYSLEPEKDEAKEANKRGNVEDRVLGERCHHCRRKRLEDHVPCSKSKCTSQFCGACLLNHHGEKIESEMAENVQWVFPKCREGCGAGWTKTCCTCGPCRKFHKLSR